MPMKPITRFALVAVVTLLLTACGFHLRRSASLPDGMQQLYLSASGSSEFRRELSRALAAAGSTLHDRHDSGVAEMRVSRAKFSNEALTVSGQGRINEYAVRFHVEFEVRNGHGDVIVPHQDIDMSREFTYDRGQAVGRTAQIEVLQKSLLQDMVGSIMFRLQAAGEHASAPAGTASTGA